jgi:uncharacterized protein YbjT (DUF2867 family)
MKILLLGATGRTGKWVLQQALEQGHQVNCLSRQIKRLHPQDGLLLFEGDPTHPDDLKTAILGCDGIISVLNISRTSDFPWATLRTPKNFLSNVMHQLIIVAEELQVQRIIVCSAWGVKETKKELPGWFRWFIDNSNIGVAYADHERQEDIITESSLKWTIVRPVGLTNGVKSQQIRESFGNKPKPS